MNLSKSEIHQSLKQKGLYIEYFYNNACNIDSVLINVRLIQIGVHYKYQIFYLHFFLELKIANATHAVIICTLYNLIL